MRCKRAAVYSLPGQPACGLGSSKPYLSKQRSQYPEAGCCEQRKCTLVLQASQSLKSLSGVSTIAMIIFSPSTASVSKTLKPPFTGSLQTEQTSPDSWSCIVVANWPTRLQSPIPMSHEPANMAVRQIRTLRELFLDLFRNQFLVGPGVLARAGGRKMVT